MKETYKCDKSDTSAPLILVTTERPTYMTKETYVYDKRGLHMCQNRHINSTDTCDQSDLHIWQKRPTYMIKEAYTCDKPNLPTSRLIFSPACIMHVREGERERKTECECVCVYAHPWGSVSFSISLSLCLFLYFSLFSQFLSLSLCFSFSLPLSFYVCLSCSLGEP